MAGIPSRSTSSPRRAGLPRIAGASCHLSREQERPPRAPQSPQVPPRGPGVGDSHCHRRGCPRTVLWFTQGWHRAPFPARTRPRLGAVQSLAPHREPAGHREVPKPLARLGGPVLWDASCQPPPLLGAEIGSQVQYTQPAPLPAAPAGKKLFLRRSPQQGCSRVPGQPSRLERARSRAKLLPTPRASQGQGGLVGAK